jgi:uncharacterized damage-inducible protein DinB
LVLGEFNYFYINGVLNSTNKSDTGAFMTEEHSPLKNHFLKIFRHMKWSDIRVLNLLSEQNINEGKAVELISHIVIAENIVYKRITNESYDNRFWDILSLEECKGIVEQTSRMFMKYISSLPDNDFQKKVSYKNSKGIDYTTSVEDILTHVAFHGIYHRGQIMLLMRNSGQNVAATDYAMYIRENEYS